MKIFRLKPGERAPDEGDRIVINALRSGRYGVTGITATRELHPAAVCMVTENSLMSDGEAEGAVYDGPHSNPSRFSTSSVQPRIGWQVNRDQERMSQMRKTVLVAALTMALTAAGKAPPSLAAYVGKYPSDEVMGVSLYYHPRFRALVVGAAPNLAIRTTVLASGVETPVERQGALLVAQMCEPHNCGEHQWTVAILSPNGPAAICYHDSDLMGDEGRWFIGGVLVARTSGCWEGNHTDVPDVVFMKLAKAR